MRVRNSFWAMLVQNEVGAPDTVVASVRQAMLDALDELRAVDVRALADTVSNAIDITELWNLRPELMTAMANEQGEDTARNRVNAITKIFSKYY